MAQAGRLGKRSASDQPSAWKPASRRACTELKPCSSPPFSEDLRAKMRTDEVAGARNFGNLSREYPETGTLWRNGRDSRAADKSAAQVRGTASGAFADRMGGRGHQRENARTGEAWPYHLRRLHPILRQLDLLVPVELPGEVQQAVGVRASVASL
jgi:hypothetical protein